MRRNPITGLGLPAAVAAAWSAQSPFPEPAPELTYLSGAYAVEDCGVLMLTLLTSGNGLRRRPPDGRRSRSGGETLRTDTLADKRAQRGGQETHFSGVELAGRPQMHGSEDCPASTYRWQRYLLAAEVIGAFTYEKRGIGARHGKCTKHFSLFAAHATTAPKEARRLAGARPFGFSQAGRIIPLAAARGAAEFAAVACDLAGGPPDEHRDHVRRELRRAGHGGRVTPLEFPGSGQGILEFEEDTGGTRHRTRMADGQFRAGPDGLRDHQLGLGPAAAPGCWPCPRLAESRWRGSPTAAAGTRPGRAPRRRCFTR